MKNTNVDSELCYIKYKYKQIFFINKIVILQCALMGILLHIVKLSYKRM